jgi:hypothetical protein
MCWRFSKRSEVIEASYGHLVAHKVRLTIEKCLSLHSGQAALKNSRRGTCFQASGKPGNHNARRCLDHHLILV